MVRSRSKCAQLTGNINFFVGCKLLLLHYWNDKIFHFMLRGIGSIILCIVVIKIKGVRVDDGDDFKMKNDTNTKISKENTIFWLIVSESYFI